VATELSRGDCPDAADGATSAVPFLGQSPVVRGLLEQVRLAGPSHAGVVICGERGSGRQALARAVHVCGAGDARPFVAVDCRHGGPQLLETQLFGYRTAQVEVEPYAPVRLTRTSRLYQANDGTLFLKYPSELPLSVQARLARLLRDGEIIDVETGQSVPFTVRVIAAVDPPFSLFAEDGKIRKDFYQRLAVIRIDLPALRNRREDIPELAAYLLRETCREAGVPVKTWTRQAVLLLSALPWRGNVRELKEFVEGIVATVPGRSVGLQDVLATVKLGTGTVALTAGRTLQEARANFEREYIAAVLAQNRGRIAETAKALGIQRTNLYRKIRHLGVAKPGRDS